LCRWTTGRAMKIEVARVARAARTAAALLSVSYAVSMGCATAPPAESPPAPSRPVLEFPSRETLATLSTKGAAVTIPWERAAPARDWTISPEAPATSHGQRWVPASAWEFAFAEEFSRSGRDPRLRRKRGSSPRSATRIRSGARRRSSSPTRCGPSWRTPAFQRTAASSTRWPFSPRAHRGGPPHPVARSQAPHDEPGPQALPRGLGTARRAPTPLPRHPPDVPHPLPGQGAQDLEEFRGLHPKNSHGGGGNRTRVRKPSALRPYVRSPRFEVGRRTGTDALPATPSRNSLAVQGPGLSRTASPHSDGQSRAHGPRPG